MVVLQIIDSLYRGGAQKVVLDIVRALPEYRHIVCYWTNEADLRDEFLTERVILVKLPFEGMKTFVKTYFFLRKVVRQYRPQVIHSHMFIPNLLTRLLPKNFALISTYHGEVFVGRGVRNSVIIALEKWTLSRCNAVVAVSHYVRHYLSKKLKTNRVIEVIHNYGEAPHVFRPYALKLPLRLVATSNNQPYKNYPLLINTMAVLSDTGISLDIYGNGMDELKSLVIDLKISNVKFRGVVPNVAEVLHNYSAYIIASHSGEGFSLALLEAMNAGLPVICSNIPQFIEAVGDEAFIFENSSVENLVQRLHEILERPEVLLSKARGSRSRALIFSKLNFIKNIADLYARYDNRN